eukprot:UC4_evm4s804
MTEVLDGVGAVSTSASNRRRSVVPGKDNSSADSSRLLPFEFNPISIHDWNAPTRNKEHALIWNEECHLWWCCACKQMFESSLLSPRQSHTCRPTFTKQHKESCFKTVTVHHWIENKSQNTYVCAWCKRQIHHSKLPDRADALGACDLGLFKSSILSASCIRWNHDESTHDTHNGSFMISNSDVLDSKLSCSPILALIDGDKDIGINLITDLCWLLNPRQVFNISCMGGNDGKETLRLALDVYKDVPGLRILAAGKYTVINRVLMALEPLKDIPTAIVVFTSDNESEVIDLSGDLGFSFTRYNGKDTDKLLFQMQAGAITKFDTWNVSFTGEQPSLVPLEYFTSNLIVDVSSQLQLICDDIEVTKSINEKGIKRIVLMNTLAINGDSLWGASTQILQFSSPSISDQKLEVIGLTGLINPEIRLGRDRVKDLTIRLAQCQNVTIKTKTETYVELDGIKNKIQSGVLSITFRKQISILLRDKNKESRERKATNSEEVTFDENSESLVASISHKSLFDSVFEESAARNHSKTASVYFLPVRGGLTGDAEFMGLIEIEGPIMTLGQVRITILTAFESLDASFKFLRFKPPDETGGFGSYIDIGKSEEQKLSINDYLGSKVFGRRHGIVVTILPNRFAKGFLQAVMDGDEVIVQNLLDKGVDVGTTDGTGSTALHLAAIYNRIQLVRKMLEDPAVDINATDNLGRTPLHCASSRNHLEICKTLLARGADFRICDIHGQTAADYAATRATKRSQTIVGLLTGFNQDPDPLVKETIILKANCHESRKRFIPYCRGQIWEKAANLIKYCKMQGYKTAQVLLISLSLLLILIALPLDDWSKVNVENVTVLQGLWKYKSGDESAKEIRIGCESDDDPNGNPSPNYCKKSCVGGLDGSRAFTFLSFFGNIIALAFALRGKEKPHVTFSTMISSFCAMLSFAIYVSFINSQDCKLQDKKFEASGGVICMVMSWILLFAASILTCLKIENGSGSYEPQE